MGYHCHTSKILIHTITVVRQVQDLLMKGDLASLGATHTKDQNYVMYLIVVSVFFHLKKNEYD